MTAEEQKRAVAAAAVAWVEPRLHRDLVLGIGTGSTADHFIDLLAPHRGRFAGVVASSSRTADRLASLSVTVFDLNDVGELPIYVDGADEINAALEMTKGGGGALTREKIVAAASVVFVCIADSSKRVTALGTFPLPIEVIPMARAQVVRALEALGRVEDLGDSTFTVRANAGGQDVVTDNGNLIVDVRGWTIRDPRSIETAIGGIVGVVESGLFALRPADVLLLSGASGVETFGRPR
ncbi:MAG: ribose-5-phosphate isomerase RpiA [Burkholderiaceae bacterium]